MKEKQEKPIKIYGMNIKVKNKLNKVAKDKSSKASNTKVTFGAKKKGKAKKKFGPTQEKPKAYRGQGR